jgi:hypothetical protein
MGFTPDRVGVPRMSIRQRALRFGITEIENQQPPEERGSYSAFKTSIFNLPNA